jgi:hypothetical protein
MKLRLETTTRNKNARAMRAFLFGMGLKNFRPQELPKAIWKSDLIKTDDQK